MSWINLFCAIIFEHRRDVESGLTERQDAFRSLVTYEPPHDKKKKKKKKRKTKTNKQTDKCAQRRLRSALASAQSDHSLRCPLEVSYPLSAQRRLVILGGCPGWSESSLGVQSFCWFRHEAAHIYIMQIMNSVKKIYAFSIKICCYMYKKSLNSWKLFGNELQCGFQNLG